MRTITCGRSKLKYWWGEGERQHPKAPFCPTTHCQPPSPSSASTLSLMRLAMFPWTPGLLRSPTILTAFLAIATISSASSCNIVNYSFLPAWLISNSIIFLIYHVHIYARHWPCQFRCHWLLHYSGLGDCDHSSFCFFLHLHPSFECSEATGRNYWISSDQHFCLHILDLDKIVRLKRHCSVTVWGLERFLYPYFPCHTVRRRIVFYLYTPYVVKV